MSTAVSARVAALGPQVSLVIPAHDEVATIAQVIAAARAAVPSLGQVLVVDDGSSDGTAEAARGVADDVLVLRENRGKGEALRAGVAAATCPILAFIDADGQDDPGELPDLLDALTDDVAMVIGSRFIGTLEDGAITFKNHLGNRLLTGCFNVLYSSRITDTQAGFRVVRREALAVEELRAVRYEIETELTLHVLNRGGRVLEVPVTRSARGRGASGFATARDGLRILRRMVRGKIEG